MLPATLDSSVVLQPYTVGVVPLNVDIAFPSDDFGFEHAVTARLDVCGRGLKPSWFMLRAAGRYSPR